MSQISMSSNKSQHSYNFSLSSNKSEKQDEQIESQQFKQKLSKLFNVKTNNLTHLYEEIQKKWSNKFVQDKILQFDAMLNSLHKVKRNNRQITKLISILGIKIQNVKKDQNIKKQIKKSTNSSKQIQIDQTNPTQSSQDYYNFKHKPISPIFNPNKQSNQSKKQNNNNTKHNNSMNNNSLGLQQKNNKYLDSYKQKNKIYEDKIKSMLDEISSIRNQLNSNKNISSNHYIEKLKFTQQEQTVQKVKQQNHIHKNKQQSQQNKNESALLKNNSKKSLSNQKYKLSSNDSTKIIKKIQFSKEINYNEKKLKQEQQQIISLMNDYVQKTNNKNNKLMEHAKNISKQLEKIKQETLQFQNKDKINNYNLNDNHYGNHYFQQSNRTMSNNHQEQSFLKQPQVIDYIAFQRHNQYHQQNKTQQKLVFPFKEQNLHNQNQYTSLNSTQLKPQTQYHQAEIYPSDIQKLKQSDSSNSVSVKNQQMKPIHMHGAKKKSILDQMKNVQSKVIISDKIIPLNNKNQIKNQNDTNIQETESNQKLKSHNLVEHVNVRNSLNNSLTNSSGKQVVISYLTMQQPSKPPYLKNLFSQNKETYKTNSDQNSNQFQSKYSQNTMNNGSINRSNSVHKIYPSINNFSNYHNTSIMNPKKALIPNKNQQNPNNSSIIQVHWRSPQFQRNVNNSQFNKNPDKRLQQQGIPNQSFKGLPSNSSMNQYKVKYQKTVVNNSLNSINNSFHNLPQRPIFQPQKVVNNNFSQQQFVPYIPNHKNRNNSYIISQPESTIFYQSKPIIETTPIKVPLIPSNQVPINNFKKPLIHSNSALNINLNDFQNRFKILQNRSSSFSQQKPISISNTQNHSFLKNTSYINKESNPFYLQNQQQTFNSLNSKQQNPNQRATFNLSYMNSRQNSLKNPFQQIKPQKQSNFFNKQSNHSRKNSFTGLNMANSTKKFQNSVTLGNSSKFSRNSRDSRYSRDSRDSRKSKSKGIHLLSQEF